VCKKADKSRKAIFCKLCKASVTKTAPAIIEIAEENETFKSGALAVSDSSSG